MLSAIVYLIIIVFTAAAIAAFFGVRIGHTVAPAICITGLTAAALALLGLTVAVPYVFAATGVAAAVLAAVLVFREKKRIYYIFTTELAVFVAAAVFVILLNVGRMYNLHDEFSHWGLAVKNLFTVGRLPLSDETNALFSGYPPFATAICYLGTCFNGYLDESATFVPMGLLLFASLLPVVTGYMRNSAKAGCAEYARLLAMIPAAAMLFCIICFKLSALTIIAVDTLLGTMGFYVTWLSVTSKRKIDNVFAVTAAFSLSLVKETGITVVMISAVIIFAAMLFRIEKKERTGAKKFFENVFAPPGTVLLAGLLSSLMWKCAKILANVPTTGGNMAKGVFAAVFGGLTEAQKVTTQAFFRAFIEPRFIRVIPLVAVLAVLAAASAGVWLMIKKTRPANAKTAGAVLISAGVCFIIYCFGLLASYWTRFTDYEAAEVASFERYVGTYLTFWLAVIAAMALTSFPRTLAAKLLSGDEKKRKALSLASICVSIMTATLIGLGFVFFYPHKARDSVSARQLTSASENIPAVFEQLGGTHSDRILLISSRYDSRLFVITNYNAAPCVVEGMEDWEAKIAAGTVSFIYFDDTDDSGLVEKAASLAGIDANVIAPGTLFKIVRGG